MSEVTRSHPQSLRNNVIKTIKSTGIKNCKLLIGLSGGSDSMALLHVLSTVRDMFGFELVAVGVNHNLREEASSELDIAEKFCNELNVPFIRRDVFFTSKSNLQENARNARYKVIREVKEETNSDYIVTAHHAEDVAETVLIRILRGTSVSGLNVLEPVNGDLFRPMVKARKRDVMLHISRKNITYCEDPSNKNTKKYLRSKVRFDIIPMLKEINPNIIEALCELSVSAKNPEIRGKRQDRKINANYK